MAVTEVTRENWFSRIIESIKGIAIGLLLVLISFPLLFWNEGRAVKTARSLTEGAAAVVTIQPDAIDGAYEGKLVHFTGEATTSETLADGTFGVQEHAIKLKRNVEMYQWKENKKTTTRRKTGGGEEKVTTYTYEKVWSDDLIASSGFKEAGHENPATKPWQSQNWTAQTVTIGAFTLSPGLVDQIDNWENLAVSEETLSLASPEVQGNLKISQGDYYRGADPSTPVIGDVRVDFQVVHPTAVSVAAMQTGAKLGPYGTMQKGYDIELLEIGTMTSDEMFEAAQGRNTTMTWVLRLVGFGMMFIGLFLIGRPLAVVADFLPVIGSFFRIGVGLFAFLVSFGCSLVTIAVAWVFYRPLLGILLLSLGGLGLVGLVAAALTIGRKKSAPEEEEPAPA